jgi:hypothetical protein
VSDVDNTLYLGNDAGDVSELEGALDDVRFYDYIRTPAQIYWEYSKGAPVAHYKLDECQGTTAYNSAYTSSGAAPGMDGTITPGASGNTAAGACSSGVTTEMWNDGTTGKRNASLGFDDTNDYVEVADNSNLDFGTSDDMTLTGWFYRSATGSDDVILAKRNGVADTDDGYILYISDSTNKLTFEVSESDGSDEYQLESASTFTSTGWYHYAVVWDQDSAANSEIYINGVDDNATDTGTVTNLGDLSNAVALRLGSESDGANYFNGLLDEIKIYRYALNPYQVRLDYNQGAVRFGPDSGQP